MVDAVFLQQNSFNDVDGVTDPKRLRVMFDVVKEIIDAPVTLKGKEEIRSHFNFMRQAYIDWNMIQVDNETFQKQKSQILNLVKTMGAC